MIPEKCRACEWYDSKLGKCSYWEVGCFYIEEDDEEDSDDSGDE